MLRCAVCFIVLAAGYFSLPFSCYLLASARISTHPRVFTPFETAHLAFLLPSNLECHHYSVSSLYLQLERCNIPCLYIQKSKLHSTMALKNILPLHQKDTSPASSHDVKHKSGQQSTRSSWKTTNRWRIEFIAAASEFAGTFMFLFFAFGGTSIAQNSQEATSGSGAAPNTSVLLYISLIFGFSLMVTVWVFFRVSGGLFNPAVSSPFPNLSSKLTIHKGHPWPLLNQHHPTSPRHHSNHLPTPRRHCRRRRNFRHPPRAPKRQHHPTSRHDARPRRLLGNVHDLPPRLHNLHARGRKTQSHLSCPHWHWPLPLRRRTARRLLHRRQFESRAQPGTRGCNA